MSLSKIKLVLFVECFIDSFKASVGEIKNYILYKYKVKLEREKGQSFDDTLLDYFEFRNNDGTIGTLVADIMKYKPDFEGFSEYADLLGLSVSPSKIGLERKLKVGSGMRDASSEYRNYGKALRRICRIEMMDEAIGESYGTGFLIGPNLIMTNYHVVQEFIREEVPHTSLKARFDYVTMQNQDDERSTTVFEGTVYGFKDKKVEAFSAYDQKDVDGDPITDNWPDDKFDYAILELEGNPALDTHGPSGDQVRGFYDLREYRNVVLEHNTEKWIYIAQHPEGSAMKFADNRKSPNLELEPNHRRVRYAVDTERGSSGAPIFNDKWELVAIHHAGDPAQEVLGTYNQGIPITSIIKDLERLGLEDLFKDPSDLKPIPTPQVNIPVPDQVDPFDQVLLAGKLPFINRLNFRDTMKGIVAKKKNRVLRIQKDSNPGLSYSYYFVQHLAQVCEYFELIRLDNQSIELSADSEGYKAENLASSLINQIGLKLNLNDDINSGVFKLIPFIGKLGPAMLGTEKTYLIFMDGLTTAHFENDGNDFIKLFARKIGLAEIKNVIFILAGYDGQLSEEVLLIGNEDRTGPIGNEDLKKFFGTFYQELSVMNNGQIEETVEGFVNNCMNIMTDVVNDQENLEIRKVSRVVGELCRNLCEAGN